MDRYELEHMADLLDVPADKIDALLAELPLVIHAARLAYTAAKSVTPEQKARDFLPRVTWVDDGRRDVTLNLNGEDFMKIERA